MKRVVLPVVGVLILAGLIFSYKLVFGKPFSFNHAVERITIKTLLRDPETLSLVGFLDNTILDFHSSRLTDVSPAFERQTIENARNDLKLITRYDRKGLGYQDQLTYDILSAYLKSIVDSGAFPYHFNGALYPGPYPVNQIYGIQSKLPEFLVSTHQVVNTKSAQNYIKRLQAVPRKFDQVLESLKAREVVDAIPPRFVLSKTIDQVEQFIAAPPEENILAVSFGQKVDQCEKINETDARTLKDKAIHAVEDSVYPAYQKLLSYLKGLESKAGTDDGVWKLRNGDEYYRWLLGFYTTSEMTPEEVHNIGLREVQRIETEMQRILAEQGYAGASVGELMDRLGKEDRFFYPDTEEGRLQILDDYSHMIREIDAGVNEYFHLRPSQTVEVQRVPVFKEKTAGGASYAVPSLDGTRPGIFYVNLRDARETPKFGMRTLAYHEAIPGHHFQMALAQQLRGLPTFRKVYPFTAFAEGWALYAEQLAWEIGFEKNPFDNLGRLQSEIFRAVRLVVDTGIHYKRWTREQAIAYMREKTGLPATEVETEIERYIVTPGQACAYTVGVIKILELRERAQRELGAAFDIRDFHDAVLQNGSVPLYVLERVVDNYIAARTGTVK